MKATTYYKGLTVEIEGTPEEIAQYIDTLSKGLNQPPDSTARATFIWQPPMWYEYYQQVYNNQGAWQLPVWNQYNPGNAGAAGANPHYVIYDPCTPKWVSPFYPTLGASLL